MWVRNRGIPDHIISQMETRFMSDFWGSLMAQLGINLRHRTNYCLQTPSQAEKLNAVIEHYLKVYVAQCLKQWDCLLQLDEFIYKAAYNKFLETSLIWADVGFVMRMPSDPLVPILSADCLPKFSLKADAIADQMMRDIHMLRERLEQVPTRTILEASKSHRTIQFHCGTFSFSRHQAPPNRLCKSYCNEVDKY
jgi:hypothetical protein